MNSRATSLLVALACLVRPMHSAQTPQGSSPRTNSTLSDAATPPIWLRDLERVHDPSTLVLMDGVRRCFCTGPGVSLMRENALGRWMREGRLFADGEFPAWHDATVPGNRGNLWAPDVIRSGKKFFVYYSVSTFGKNT